MIHVSAAASDKRKPLRFRKVPTAKHEDFCQAHLSVATTNSALTISSQYTGVLQFRAPGELGGIYFSVNMFLGLFASFVGVFVGGGGRVEWTIVSGLSFCWCVSFATILGLMRKEYRKSFFSFQTGKQYTISYFESDDDVSKMEVVLDNKLLWWDIREEVKEWVEANWWKWRESQPEWFTPAWMSKVPLDWIPVEDEEAKKIRVSFLALGSGKRRVVGSSKKVAQLRAVVPVAAQ